MIKKNPSQTTNTVCPPLQFDTASWFAPELTKLAEHLNDRMVEMMRYYPESDYKTLRTMISKRNELHVDNIVITAGRTAAFYVIAEAFAGKRGAILVPSYQHYELAAKRYGWQLTYIPEDVETQEIKLEGEEFCWICSPNSSTGRFRSRAELLDLISAHPQVFFIVDQSYASFTTQPTLTLSDVKSHPNIIFVSSFTQTYGLPGLRIGYVTADKKVVKEIQKVIDPWSVSTMAVEVAKYILIHPAQFTLPIRKWQRNALELETKLRQIDGLEVMPSDAPFFLVQIHCATAAELVNYLLEEHNIALYDATKLRGIKGEMVRITSRDATDNAKLVEAIAAFCESR
ncbi:MAG: aminotransferase class I/II-fold pyridoxal phosphate-dependent enzyme [Porphyromonas sp.]|uniref:aminotransferase class I/II-fold pyridoxal phosphate-dependent enzyme n=1 Tax=Porphyromonas sp. TaxID=1924944 RepID=UPI002A759DC2|nr:aminotransferase class I/II-fold pyridoxal phosphate-dependent enzyme [Porphyromonas sp.]MDD6928933.1 aminotransferase class I/II-fold pyridoxal phosphate-dependent enzyme [Bacteroidales bacterium]MDY3111941.1 aminotransferase class I/II-fold pyridoxal phosphate-dependent enzyme [Porphyromonas sp.]